ncbi:RNA chaperone Hfq [Staphylococcus sp. SQ8-PEA]|uniref:RNA-binding protein Hfq n=1 Tax=Staphylococcus marylandisciuri TaxID=2981529 RepID=A0ABT2QS29_9STAP|nr:RNA chaperone Hfq [Staphylococcus marylandisciuri]MCU5746784.1 RNA chaperone Hfq [Staphylococcus marylandisciuri]
MTTTNHIQDQFLGQFKAEKTEVIIFFTNGFQMKGVIEDYDEQIVILYSKGKQHLIYKHAISTFTLDDGSEE